MSTECSECDRYAVRYWGRAAYCRQHLEDARLEDPRAHECPTCGVEQPPHVHWERKAPCRQCQKP